MKLFTPILTLLMLAACGSDAQQEEKGGQGVGSLAVDPALPSAEAQAARAQALVEAAVPTALGGATDARYRNVRAGVGGAACGEVASKTLDPKGGYRPFLVTPEGVAIVADAPKIAFNDPEDVFADGWIRWCATPEELQALAPKLREPLDVTEPLNEAQDDPLGDALLPPPVTNPVSPPSSAGRPEPPAAEAPPPQLDSFFNSVQRSGER